MSELPQDEMVVQRLQEIKFGATGAQVRSLLIAGDTKAAKLLLASMETNAAQHPWLQEKLARLKESAERDAVMASKELRYSGFKMSSRLAFQMNVDFCTDETNSGEVPAYWRRKSSEGKGGKA